MFLNELKEYCVSNGFGDFFERLLKEFSIHQCFISTLSLFHTLSNPFNVFLGLTLVLIIVYAQVFQLFQI